MSSLFTAVSWCREIINSFIYLAAFRPASDDSQLTQEHEGTRQKVVAKLKCLLELEEELSLCAKKCFSFTPPGLRPLPLPRDLQNVSKDNEIDDDNELLDNDKHENLGRMTAEEKKALATIKKAAKKKATDTMKSKQKALKLKAKHEGLLENRALSALRPLSAYTALALGFPELRVVGSNFSSSQELMLSLGASELKNVRVGDGITNTLLLLFNDGLNSLFNRDKATTVLEDLSENPYTMCSKNRNNEKTEFQFLDLCIDGDVFVSIHERLVAAAEILGDSESSDDRDKNEDTLECTRLLLQCVTTLLGAEELHSPPGRVYFEAIMKQIADGDQRSSKTLRPMKNYPTFMRSAAALFDLLEEALTGSDTDDLCFTMVGVDCVDAVVRRASAIQALDEDNGTKATPKERLQLMKIKVSNLCLGLLRRQWRDGTALNKSNVGKLVALYLEHSSLDSKDTSSNQFEALKWGRLNALYTLINEALTALPKTDGCKGPVQSFSTCCRSTFGCYFSSVLTALTEEASLLFQSPIAKSNDSVHACLTVLKSLISLMNQTFDLTKNNASLAKSPYLLMQLKNGTKFIDVILKRAIPFCIKHFQSHDANIIEIIEGAHNITRQMSFILSHGKRAKDSNLIREGPKVRKVCESFIHDTKALMQKNGVLDAFWGGNLKNKNIDGSKVEESGDSDGGESDKEDEEGSDTESEAD